MLNYLWYTANIYIIILRCEHMPTPETGATLIEHHHHVRTEIMQLVIFTNWKISGKALIYI
jgi:hypothetical protein